MQARTFDDYEQALIISYNEEVSGEAYFARLAEFNEGRARQALCLLAQMESVTARVIMPVLARHGLKPDRHDALRQAGREEAEARREQSWPERVKAMVSDFPVFVEEFDQIEALAPASDREQIAILKLHEEAAIEFAGREAAGRADSLEPLEHFLARHALTDDTILA